MTERVHVHSSKEVVIVVGPYLVQVDKVKGVTVGVRKANKDASVNELDDTKAHFALEDIGVNLVVPNKDKSDHTSISLLENMAKLEGTDGSGDAGALELLRYAPASPFFAPGAVVPCIRPTTDPTSSGRHVWERYGAVFHHSATFSKGRGT